MKIARRSSIECGSRQDRVKRSRQPPSDLQPLALESYIERLSTYLLSTGRTGSISWGRRQGISATKDPSSVLSGNVIGYRTENLCRSTTNVWRSLLRFCCPATGDLCDKGSLFHMRDRTRLLEASTETGGVWCLASVLITIAEFTLKYCDQLFYLLCDTVQDSWLSLT